jgi:FixJ family two-component response regulator
MTVAFVLALMILGIMEASMTRRPSAVDAGCIAYLRKPFARQVLLDAIGKAVA